MAIRVKHEGNITSRVVASSLGGKGKRQAEDAARLVQIQNQADIAAQDRASRESMHTSGTAAHLAASGLRGAPGIMGAPSGPSGLISPPGIRGGGGQRFSVDSAPYDDRPYPEEAPVKTGYTDKQREEFNALSEALVRAEQSGDYTPEELKELRRQVTARQLGIQPVRIMGKESAYPDGQGIGEIWTLDNGTVVTRNSKGDVSKIADARNEGGMPNEKAFQMAFKMASDEAGAKKDGVVTMARVKEIMGQIQATISGGAVDEGGGESQIPYSFMDDFFGFSEHYGSKFAPAPKAADDGAKDDPAKKWRVN
ncbi:MAG TPA: hypothetical protein P5527_02330 [Kiritimatiellia bacterium]|nr:hypothetical protein [Kiritimatiellia bacterium]